MYFVTIILSLIFAVCVFTVGNTGGAIVFAVLSLIAIAISYSLIRKELKISKALSNINSTKNSESYGYSMDNPIFTKSVHSEYVFLDSLKTTDGSSTQYERDKAYFGVDIGGQKFAAVDVYKIKAGGSLYATLYICPYGKDLNIIPKGFAGYRGQTSKSSTNTNEPQSTVDANQQKADILCNGMDDKMFTMAFPGGNRQVKGIILSLCKIYDINMDDCTVAECKEVLSTYVDVLVRKVVTHSDDNSILASLKVKHPTLVKSDQIAQLVMSFVIMNMANNQFEIQTDDDLKTIGFMSEEFENEKEIRQKNASVQTTDFYTDPEFGLVPQKPIYTVGVDGSQTYLNSLTTVFDEKLCWERQGSMSIEGINGMIDIYEGYLPSGKRYKTLYVNMYGTANPTTAPKGFNLLK